MIGGIEIHSSPLVPSHVPNITFDPQRKCAWATPEFRATMDKWLLDRFGSHAVAFMFNPRASGLGFGGPMAVLHPRHVAMLRTSLGKGE